MTSGTPRLKPLPPSELTPEVRESLEPIGGDRYNVFLTLARHPGLLTRYRKFGGYLVTRSSLSPRQLKLLILRTAWHCRNSYEWIHHDASAADAGLTEDEVRGVTAGPAWERWSADDRALMQAADDLCSAHRIEDETWSRLTHLGDQGLIEVCFVVGMIMQASLFQNSAGLEIEDWLDVEPVVPPPADWRRD